MSLNILRDLITTNLKTQITHYQKLITQSSSITPEPCYTLPSEVKESIITATQNSLREVEAHLKSIQFLNHEDFLSSHSKWLTEGLAKAEVERQMFIAAQTELYHRM